MPFADTWMKLEMHTEWSKSERGKQISYINTHTHIYIYIYIWNLEKWYRWTYLQGRNRDTDVENKCIDTARERRVGWIGRLELTSVHYGYYWVLGSRRSPGEGMTTHSSILAWRIPRTEEPGGPQSMESQRIGHDWATNTFTI